MSNFKSLAPLLAASVFFILTPACGAESQSSSPVQKAEPEQQAAPQGAPGAGAPSKEMKMASLEVPTSGGWRVDYGKSTLSFTATQVGSAFTGRFEKYDAEIVFDPSDLEAASINVSVDMNSAKTGDRQRDVALPEKDWFDARAHPTATFVSQNIKSSGGGDYVAHGTLTIRETSKAVDLPFHLEINGDTAHATGGLTLVRTDFGVGQGEFSTDEWVGLEVDVKIDITATR